MEFQVKLNKDCEFEIIDINEKLDANIRSALNQLINARENFDTDFLSDLSVYRTKRFQNYFVSIVSNNELDVIENVYAHYQALEDAYIALEEKEMYEFDMIVRAELEAFAA